MPRPTAALVGLALVLSLLPATGGPSLAAAVPNDPYFADFQWNLRQVRAPEAWDLTTGDRRVIIAIVDTGIALDHPDLIDKLVPGINLVTPGAPPADDNGHGTHMAGIAAAATNNALGIAGLNWEARLIRSRCSTRTAAATSTASRRASPGPSTRARAWSTSASTAPSRRRCSPTPCSTRATRAPSSWPPWATTAGPTRPTLPRSRACWPWPLPTATTSASPRPTWAATWPWPPPGRTSRARTGTRRRATPTRSPAPPRRPRRTWPGWRGLIWSVNPDLSGDAVRRLIENHADDVGRPGRDDETGSGRINAYRSALAALPWNYDSGGGMAFRAPSEAAARLYLPYVVKASDGWTSSIMLHNPTAQAVTLTCVHQPNGHRRDVRGRRSEPAGGDDAAALAAAVRARRLPGHGGNRHSGRLAGRS